MTDLLGLLRRANNPAERKEIAQKLTESPDGIIELKRMALGEHRGLWHWYNAQDQLAAIDCLGKSGIPMALQFLESKYSPSCRVIQGSNELNDMNESIMGVYSVYFSYTFPMKRKTGVNYGVVYESKFDKDHELNKVFSAAAHQAFIQAIKRLEASTGIRQRVKVNITYIDDKLGKDWSDDELRAKAHEFSPLPLFSG